MKKLLRVFLVSALSLTLAAGAIMAQGPGNAVRSPEDIVDDYPAAELSEKQIADLEFMYEEEKLARDLYARLGEEWNLPAFENISQSEAQHMAALEALFAKYDLEKPAAVPGEYNNSELAAVYDEFLARGLESEAAALELGKELEIKDIADLEEVMIDAPEDFKAVYANLKAVSENHLAA
ncbi:DUF2202 domain-containing protein, partial [Halanaerobium sp.]|uniref:DUF2202 domain-containing protein n=1 Tax=Halanaerobium sp. TaxID=1895664 RepID=UPI000DE6E8D9